MFVGNVSILNSCKGPPLFEMLVPNNTSLPERSRFPDIIESLDCNLSSNMMSQKSFNLNESLDIPPDELGMGVWYSKSPDHTSKSGNWNPDASKFSVGLDIGDVGDFYGDIMLDERFI